MIGSLINFERHCYLVLKHRITLKQLYPQHQYLSRLKESYKFASSNCITSFTEVTFIVRTLTIS